jgi:hypothetical protein
MSKIRLSVIETASLAVQVGSKIFAHLNIFLEYIFLFLT